MRSIAATLLTLLPAVATLAQSTPNLMGVTLNTPVLHQSVHSTCTQLGNCPLGLLPTSLFYWPGGAAWDPGSSSAWVTTGQAIGRFDPTSCAVNCGPVPCPKSAAVAEATGLDINDSTNELWTIDSLGWITRSTNNCALGFVNAHNTGLTLSGFTATTGITIDELRGLVFYSTADFSIGSGTIYVAPLSNPGAWYQAIPVFDCFSNTTLITGLAVDAANAVLYWTNGRGTFDWSYTVTGPTVTFTPGACCIQATPFPDPYTDLSIRWGGATSTGAPCANGNCLPCPMVHSLRNAPLLGTTLQLGLDLAQVGMPTWCILGVGTCASSGITPPLCGNVLVPLNPTTVTLPLQYPTGGVGCSGSTTWLLALPANPSLAGLPMASQCVGLCAPFGTAMSNCLSFVLQ
ncbi:MAG: hypothetical protein IT456_08205 [Planctomycetes bacterium]|jgi:hypothetical protein|nr:hypothetical protein [Planctomycetota bacterium]